ncbi:MAG: phosphotransferase [Proteobacteria bacterium]|nr:phosphotransferase [Pseudomonadota bacterium]
MQATRTPDEVLAKIPGWAGAAWTELEGGLTNRAYHVSRNFQHGVLKFDDLVRDEPLNTRRAEADVQSIAAQAGLAPRVLFVDENVFLTEYVDGTVWQPQCLRKTGNLELLAAAMKRLHGLPLTGRSFDATAASRRYLENIRHPDASLVELCNQVIERTRLPHKLSCCHNDLVAENMITAPDLLFIDWEYACDNDPCFDLATVVEHHRLPEEQVRRLLDAYFGADGQRWSLHLAEQQKLYLALLWLWMASLPENCPGELDQVAERLTTSCS